MENCTQQINARNNFYKTDNKSLTGKGFIDKNTNPLFGTVNTIPSLDSEVVLSDYSNINIEFLRNFESNKKYPQLKNNSTLFLSFRDGNWEIYSADPKGIQIKNLTNNPMMDISPSWSPDGQEIAFSSNRFGNLEILIMKNNGTNIQRLTNNIFNDSFPVWFPDGKKISYCSELRQRFIIDRDGSNAKSVDPDLYVKPLPGDSSTSYCWLQDL
jgi:Tol biopolymer transport system component